ncbi:hypothetical protein UFOVP201_17 [uncultured Caudovirales phage]|uniref:Uncharacterized protein n=1 Tax=uncultured Caudovirales phage TaxID=2100421 RepID=A0A6J7WLV0_9CAUD|nr:hypothetical protein UFOVP201_17 [uncultured Caudovirales phage]
MNKRTSKAITIKRRWKRLWTNEPHKMETIRQKATLTFKQNTETRNNSLIKLVSQWPKTMTTEQFKQLCERAIAANPNTNRKRASCYESLRKRLKRLNVITFNSADLCWINNVQSVCVSNGPLFDSPRERSGQSTS